MSGLRMSYWSSGCTHVMTILLPAAHLGLCILLHRAAAQRSHAAASERAARARPPPSHEREPCHARASCSVSDGARRARGAGMKLCYFARCSTALSAPSASSCVRCLSNPNKPCDLHLHSCSVRIAYDTFAEVEAVHCMRVIILLLCVCYSRPEVVMQAATAFAAAMLLYAMTKLRFQTSKKRT